MKLFVCFISVLALVAPMAQAKGGVRAAPKTKDATTKAAAIPDENPKGKLQQAIPRILEGNKAAGKLLKRTLLAAALNKKAIQKKKKKEEIPRKLQADELFDEADNEYDFFVDDGSIFGPPGDQEVPDVFLEIPGIDILDDILDDFADILVGIGCLEDDIGCPFSTDDLADFLFAYVEDIPFDPLEDILLFDLAADWETISGNTPGDDQDEWDDLPIIGIFENDIDDTPLGLLEIIAELSGGLGRR